MKKRILYIISLCSILASCQDTDGITGMSEQDGELINVGGVSVGDVLDVNVSEPATRADNTGDPDAAEKQEWLIKPLKDGLDITYGRVGAEAETGKVAILKLAGAAEGDQELAGPAGNQYAVDKDTKWAVYSFKYRADDADAFWHGNGAHYFEGQYVPEPLRFGSGTANASSTIETVNTTSAPGLHTNQTDKIGTGVTTGNYTLLTQYLGMPASFRLSATVARIKLPFRHRLCRVLAYVLIDPGLGQGVTLEGYKKTDAEKTEGKDDPQTTELHFSNVKVLTGVKDELADGHHTLTPQWDEVRKIVPHFVEERGSQSKTGAELDQDFIVYYDINNETYTFPTDDDWDSKKTTYENSLNSHDGDVQKTEEACHIRKINYGKVPVYDIIARPTYTKIENVMYDEDGVKNTDGTENVNKKREYLNEKNKIDFDLTLSNGLQYSKEFVFDLDANYETVVYLRINAESVDYNSSGAELWINETKNDDWYGIDNQNGNSLSVAGSSWQRAFTLGATADDDNVTDGGYYNENTTGEDGTPGQYLTDATWKKYFAQAYEGGEHHGDYFILKKNIDIDAKELPVGFVFTGHLDAQDKTITVTDAGKWVTCDNEVLSKLKHKKPGATGTDNDDYFEEIPQLYYQEEIAQKPRSTRADIGQGTPIEIDMNSTTGAKLVELAGKYAIFYIDGTEYKVYTNRTFYKKTASALFCGLNGIYTTKQEEADNPYAIPADQWEANVHKEKNDKGTAKEYWVPYKGTSTGWRAEVINTKVKGTMFTSDAVVTGNVQNCFEGDDANTKIENRTPEYPKYK